LNCLEGDAGRLAFPNNLALPGKKTISRPQPGNIAPVFEGHRKKGAGFSPRHVVGAQRSRLGVPGRLRNAVEPPAARRYEILISMLQLKHRTRVFEIFMQRGLRSVAAASRSPAPIRRKGWLAAGVNNILRNIT
jgi:hypothetical protein